MAAAGVYMVGFLGLLIRFALSFTYLPDWLQSRNEVVTPLTSWKRGKHLNKYNVELRRRALNDSLPLPLAFWLGNGIPRPPKLDRRSWCVDNICAS